MSFCSACGVEGDGDFCSACGKPRALPRSSVDALTLQIRSVNDRMRNTRHGVPALLSFFIPGLGQMVKGQFILGALIMLGSIAFGLLCFAVIGLVLLPLLWIWQLYDAYVNPDAETLADADRIRKISGR